MGEDFAAWVEPHWGAMRRAAERLAGRAGRDDVLQDALTAAWRGRRGFDETRGTLRAWLVTIVVNEARRAHRRFVPVDVLDDAAVDDPAPNVDLERAVTALPRRQRVAVELFYFVGLGVDEVAEVMDCASGTVKSTLSAARANLRTALGEEYV